MVDAGGSALMRLAEVLRAVNAQVAKSELVANRIFRAEPRVPEGRRIIVERAARIVQVLPALGTLRPERRAEHTQVQVQALYRAPRDVTQGDVVVAEGEVAGVVKDCRALAEA